MGKSPDTPTSSPTPSRGCPATCWFHPSSHTHSSQKSPDEINMLSPLSRTIGLRRYCRHIKAAAEPALMVVSRASLLESCLCMRRLVNWLMLNTLDDLPSFCWFSPVGVWDRTIFRGQSHPITSQSGVGVRVGAVECEPNCLLTLERPGICPYLERPQWVIFDPYTKVHWEHIF